MIEYATKLRRWLEGLTDDDLLLAASYAIELRRALPTNGNGRAARRGLPRVRKELRHASDERLSEIVRSSFSTARRELRLAGWDDARINEPTRDDLHAMLSDLPAVLGALTLWGLLVGEAPATPLARANDAEFLLLIAGDPLPVAREEPVAPGEAAPAPRTGPPPEPTQEACAALRERLARVRDEARSTAAAIRTLADELEAGLRPGTGALAIDLSGVARRLREAFDDVAGVLRSDAPPDDLAGALAAVEAAERAAVEQSAAAARAEQARTELREEIARLRTFIASTAPEFRGPLEGVLADHVRRLSELDGAEPGREHAAGPVGETSSTVGEGNPESLPVVPPEPVAETELIAEPQLEPATEPQPEAVAEPEAEAEAVAEPEAEAEAEPEAEAEAEPVAPLEPVAETEHDADGLRLAFPWDAGSPPPVVTLVESWRLAEAYWLTIASDESPSRGDVLRFAHAAFATSDATAAARALNRWDTGVSEDREAVLTETAALLRCGLEAGWSHRLPTLDSMGITLAPPWSEFVAVASDAVRQQCCIERGTDPGGSARDDVLADERARLVRQARQMQDELPKRRNKYARATVVQQWLLRRDRPLGRLLALVVGSSESTASLEELRRHVAELRGHQAVDRLIEDADQATRSTQQREAIIAGARKQLVTTIESVIDLGQRSVVVADRTAVAHGSAPRLLTRARDCAAAALASSPDEGAERPGVGSAVLRLLAQWVRDPDANGSPPATTDDDVPDDALLLLPDLPRGPDREPLLDHPDARAILVRSALPPPEPAEIVQRHARHGALDLAERTARRFCREEPGTLLDDERARWQGLVDAARDDAEVLLDRLRTLLDVPTSLTERLPLLVGTISAPPQRGNAAYDLELVRLTAVRDEVATALDDRVGSLRAQVLDEVEDEELRGRIEALLDEEDTVTAHEFLARHRGGERLPEVVVDPVAGLRDFTRALDRDLGAGDDPWAWAEVFLTAAEDGPSEAARTALTAWGELANARDTRLRSHVESVLRLIGIDPQPGSTTARHSDRSHVRGFSVRGRPRDGALMPQLGSGARGRYKVVVVREERRGRSPVDDVDPSDTDVPTLVLYVSTMSPEMRERVAADAWSRRAPVLVIDPPVVGCVAARAPGSFRALQRLTLPWSTFDPFQPFVAGLVPSELFVGRESERRQIVDPQGGLFVYGGRQLGKSALLRRIEADPGDERTAVYLDLKGLGIGEALTPDHIWSAIAEELKRREVLPAKVSSRVDADVVVREIEKWLAVDDTRQLLVLADEADAFLTADSQGTPTSGGVAHFPNMGRLKQLMERTRRRFKIVFVGLHQVQRFGHLSNVPTPHGGPDILIGPLHPEAARRLVVEPLAALGFTFARPELVWRVLAATNYQPAPIQIFCLHLLAHLREEIGTRRGIPVTIDRAQVDRVAAHPAVRALIAERTRITVNLEDRYRVLALLIARKATDDGFRRSYDAAELLDEASAVWAEGFTEFSEDDLTVHLDEMCGLGLLARPGGERAWSMRSPNVVGMLGTRDDFERELAASDFDLGYEYNPRLSRRLLAQEDDGLRRRSPLSDSELVELATTARARRTVPVVVGSEALALDRVFPALSAHLETGETRVCRPVTPVGLKEQLTTSTRTRAWIALDLRGVDTEGRLAALEQALRGPVPVVAIADVGAASDPPPASIVTLSRWSPQSVRSWPDSPFDTPQLRQGLIAASGGWPEVVEQAIATALSMAGTAEQTLTQLSAHFPADAAAARALLAKAGIDDELTSELTEWVELTSAGELLPEDDVASTITGAAAGAPSVMARLRRLGVLDERPGGIALDQLTHRCIARAAALP